MNTRLQTVHARGQRFWLDNLSRDLVQSGTLNAMLSSHGIAGVTSNPSIFLKALQAGIGYAEDKAKLHAAGLDAEARYESLAIADIQAACDVMRSLFDASCGYDGWVSFEVSPALAHDAEGTCIAARRLSHAVNRPNLMIKVPATLAGTEALTTLIREGISVNVTLMFSMLHVRRIFDAYQSGIQQRQALGLPLTGVTAVASVFMSRVDTLVDSQLHAPELQGKAALALAKVAYAYYQTVFQSPDYMRLCELGATPQRLLWASTGTKNPRYPDTLYVDHLVGKDTINTLPPTVLAAFYDHGQASMSLTEAVDAADAHLDVLDALGLSLDVLGEQLQEEGLALFAEAYKDLLAVV